MMSRSSKILTAIACLVLVGALGYIWVSYAAFAGGMEAPEGRAVAHGEGPRMGAGGGGGEPGERLQQIAEELDLTAEQKAQLDAAREQLHASGEFRPGMMREQMEAILTPEQRAKAQEHFSSRSGEWQQRMAAREQEARETLSPEDFKVWQQKRDARAAQFQGRRGGAAQ
jgi:Spy/CpxP family protein refolding chaperone